MDQNLRWEDPPTRRGGARFDAEAPEFQELRTNPKRWARLQDFEKSSSAQSRASSLRYHLGEEFEVITRKLDDSTTALFARYVGPQQG